jgi:Flp pilus assembly protein TadG
MIKRRKLPRWLRRFLTSDNHGIATLEAAFVMPPFLFMLLLIIETGVYFILQSALDVGVLATAESLRTSMQAGSGFSAPTAAALKSTINTNCGVPVGTSGLSVDVRQLATLSAGTVAIADGTDDWGGSGSVLILRAQATMLFLPGFTPPIIRSASVIRRPSY